MLAKDRIIVALDDTSTIQAAISLGREIGTHVWGFKVGLELIHSEMGGYKAASAIQAWAGNNILYDCKLHDIPQQVADTVSRLIPLQLKMFTVHCSGGVKMMQAAQNTATQESKAKNLPKPLVLGVTILTSLDFRALTELGFDNFMRSDFPMTFTEQAKDEYREKVVQRIVVNLAKLAKEAGLDGVICSPHEAKSVREVWPKAVIVTPGIRAAHAPADDQKRTATAREAIEAGADYLVIGRPITQAPDPIVAVEKIALEIEES